jgi:plasmid stabilization system protein ParE
MTVKVFILRSAEADLRELQRYVRKRFGEAAWNASYSKIKRAVAKIALHPRAGKLPDELLALNLAQYRQAMAGANRIIYELRDDAAYVHLICDERRDLRALLLRRVIEAGTTARSQESNATRVDHLP